MNLGKVSTALITPFTVTGEVDFNQLESVVNHLIDTGTESIVVNGTTAESPVLSQEEKLAVIQAVVEYVNGRVPVLAGTGSNNTAQTIAFTKQVEVLGVDGCMVVAPYYNKPNQRSLVAHFTAIADAAEKPLMLYNIPGRSVINMSAETTAELSQHPSIFWMKEASGDVGQITRVISQSESQFGVYSGDDGLSLPLYAIGSKGIVSVASHIVGREMQEMFRAFDAGNHVLAARYHQLLQPLFDGLFTSPNPTVVKYALSKLHGYSDAVRLPLLTLTDEEKAQFDQLWTTFETNRNNLLQTIED
ncbi:4-hydroxy-tetrahydrodipicolinate synthase [Chryseomicrobium sp. FSL W7-1435]|uniref:4-hydroxy-tetrahydrodipicolinate synthase n=1 Tax=Chryseomicrobium sp. FSL W7-1435 TaxID=2921704 RepID=UPI00315A776E